MKSESARFYILPYCHTFRHFAMLFNIFSIFIQNLCNASFSFKITPTCEFSSHHRSREMSFSYACNKLLLTVFSLRFWKVVIATLFVLTYTHVYRNIFRNVE